MKGKSFLKKLLRILKYITLIASTAFRVSCGTRVRIRMLQNLPNLRFLLLLCLDGKHFLHLPPPSPLLGLKLAIFPQAGRHLDDGAWSRHLQSPPPQPLLTISHSHLGGCSCSWQPPCLLSTLASFSSLPATRL